MKKNVLTGLRKKALLWMLISSIVMFLSVSSSAKEKQTTLLIWGDSLSAAYGMSVDKGWVHLLQEEYKNLRVVNGSISGETTRGGLSRLPEALATHSPDIVLIELGANDGLRGLSIDAMNKNLTAMIEAIQVTKAKIIIAPMKIPPNYGLQYTQRFEETFEVLAKSHKLTLTEFFLKDIAEDFELMQVDGLHPTVEAQPIILDNVRPAIESVLNELKE